MKLMITTIPFLLLLSVAPAAAQLPVEPDYTLSTAAMTEANAPGYFVLLVRPDGHGPDLGQARDIAGNTVDATLTVTVIGPDGNLIPDFPREDMWLAPAGGVVPVCDSGAGGMLMDADTDMFGRALLSQAPRAGGYNDGPSLVYLNATPLVGPALDLGWNSPDINGDLRVDLTDAGYFAADLHGAYAFRSDFVYDGVIDLSDAGVMASAMGISCP